MTTASTAPAPDTLLRDLSDEQFREAYGTDRFTATVLSNRLRYSAQHMATDLLHRSFTPLLALSYDFAASICAPPELGYSMSAVTSGLTVFIGTMADGVRVAVEEYGIERLEPGDLLVCNDPSRMGNHVNDVCYIRPVFHDGRVVSFVVLRAHMSDLGGITPGGFSPNKRSTYETGLVLSPRLLFHREEPVRETFSLYFDNVRFGESQLPDLKTIHACCQLGERLIQESIERYGIDAYFGTLRYACDASAETMRVANARLPDGDYEASDCIDADGIDADEEYRVHLTLRKRGAKLEVDFSGSSRQARTAINAGPLDAKSAIGVGLKMLLDPDSEFTSGTFRDIDLVIPPGTITSALPPDGPIFFYWEVEALIMTVLLRALNAVLGDRALGGDYGCNNVHNAYGTAPDGTSWACSAQAGGETGPWGGSRVGDGDGCTATYLLNIMAASTEVLEHDFPLTILRREYLRDSAGPGFNRGGAAIVRDIQWRQDAEHVTIPLRFRHSSGVGVSGGRDGALGGVWIFDRDGGAMEGAEIMVGTDDSVYRSATVVAGTMNPVTNAPQEGGEFHYYCSTPVWNTGPGAMWRYLTNGGGGWGDPFDREPERVRNDVRDGYVTIDAAARDYGVVIAGDPERDPEGLEIDREATQRLRAAR